MLSTSIQFACPGAIKTRVHSSGLVLKSKVLSSTVFHSITHQQHPHACTGKGSLLCNYRISAPGKEWKRNSQENWFTVNKTLHPRHQATYSFTPTTGKLPVFKAVTYLAFQASLHSLLRDTRMGFEMTIWPYVFVHSFYIISALSTYYFTQSFTILHPQMYIVFNQLSHTCNKVHKS